MSVTNINKFILLCMKL